MLVGSVTGLWPCRLWGRGTGCTLGPRDWSFALQRTVSVAVALLRGLGWWWLVVGCGFFWGPGLSLFNAHSFNTNATACLLSLGTFTACAGFEQVR